MKAALYSFLAALLACGRSTRNYRSRGIPRGVDFPYDIERDFGCNTIKMIFDVGANIGQSALHYAKDFPKATIYSFEPVASSYQQLLKNTEHLPQVHAMEFGFGEHDEWQDIHIPFDSRLSSISTHRPGDKVEQVWLASLNRYCEPTETLVIDLLKLDVEGHELAILRGGEKLLTEHRVKFIQVEAAPSSHNGYFANFDNLSRYLAKYGYELYGIYDQTAHFSGRKSLLFCNLVFVSPELLTEPWFVSAMKGGGEA